MSRRVVAAGALALVIAGGGAATGAVTADGAEGTDSADGEVAFTFTDTRIDESSGLVAAGDVVVTVNDSGDVNRVFTVDTASGATVGITTWPGDAVDVEALAPAGDGEVWVGDIGDNDEVRATVRVTRVPFGRGDLAAAPPSYELVYPDGPHDAETLLADSASGRLHVVVKDVRGRVYAAPERLRADRPNRLRAVGHALGLATDGAVLPDGRHAVLRSYGQAVVYTWPDLERVGGFALPHQPQGEALAVDSDGSLLLSTEGASSDVLRVPLPDDLRAAMAATGAPTVDPSSPPPTDVAEATERDLWPWALGGVVGLLLVAVLVRSLRPR